MKNYADLLRKILDEGQYSADRTGVGTVSLFGQQLRFDMSEGFPLATGKETNFAAIKEELRWFLSGSTNVDDLDSSIWDSWANYKGDVGPVYGHQWRNWGGHLPSKTGGLDQIKKLVTQLKTDPESRRHVVSTWNVDDIDDMGLPCCHILFQCYVRKGKISLQMYQRSADMFLGVPFNIASYGLLLELLAYECGLVADELIITLGDCHIYDNHMEQVAEYLKRGRRELPTLLVHASDTCAATFNVELLGYGCGDKIPAPVAV